MPAQAGSVREISVRWHVSGKALATGIADDPEPVASAMPLMCFSNAA
jgi:hypothetical protein